MNGAEACYCIGLLQRSTLVAQLADSAQSGTVLSYFAEHAPRGIARAHSRFTAPATSQIESPRPPSNRGTFQPERASSSPDARSARSRPRACVVEGHPRGAREHGFGEDRRGAGPRVFRRSSAPRAEHRRVGASTRARRAARLLIGKSRSSFGGAPCGGGDGDLL
jgi:hypothetical protein